MDTDKFFVDFFTEPPPPSVIHTLSPNQRYFFRIRNVQDIKTGLFGCPIAFYDIAGKLIYHNRKFLAECLPDKKYNYENADLVHWSDASNMVIFIERKFSSSLHLVLLDLERKKFYRKEAVDKPEYRQFYASYFRISFDEEKARLELKDEFEEIRNHSTLSFRTLLGLDPWRP